MQPAVLVVINKYQIVTVITVTEVAISSVSSFLAGKHSMTYSPRNVLLFSNRRTPLALITRLLTGRADIPVMTTAQIKIPSDI